MVGKRKGKLSNTKGIASVCALMDGTCGSYLKGSEGFC